MEVIPINGGGGLMAEVLGRIFAGSPYPDKESVKILGVVCDAGLTFAEQIASVFERAKIRMAVLARVAGSSWGPETGMLRLTHEALLTSLVRYGWAVIGSGIHEERMLALNTRIVNVAARKVAGASRSERRGALHAAAGVLSAQNLLLMHCALSLDRTVRAYGSSIREWLLT